MVAKRKPGVFLLNATVARETNTIVAGYLGFADMTVLRGFARLPHNRDLVVSFEKAKTAGFGAKGKTGNT